MLYSKALSFFISVFILLAPTFSPAQEPVSDNSEEVVDIMLAVDVSGSMKVEDLTPTRLDAVKIAIEELMKVHPTGRFGIVIFASEAQLVVPLNDSLKYDKIEKLIRTDAMEGTGTVIGEALAYCSKEFDRINSKKMRLVIFSDGATSEEKEIFREEVNFIHKRKIDIYAVGVGLSGNSTITTKDNQTVNVKSPYNDASLRQISISTNGKYFHAENTKEMKKIADEIAKLIDN